MNDMWLIRTIGKEIIGPYKTNEVEELILKKKIVFLDEISKSTNDWELIKNIDDFKDIALETGYDISESTKSIDISDSTSRKDVYNKRTPVPPKFDKAVSNPKKYRYEYLQGKQSFFKSKSFIALASILLVFIFYFGIKKLVNYKTSISYKYGKSSTYETFNKIYIKAEDYREGGLFRKASFYYKKALKFKPSHSGIRIKKLAIDLYLNENIKTVEKDFKKLYAESNIGKIPDQYEQSSIRTFLGLLEAKKRNYESAMDYFNQSLVIKQTNAHTYYNLGRIKYEKKEYKKALEYFRNAQKLTSNFLEAILYEGLCLIKLNQNIKAYSLFSSSVLVENLKLKEFYVLGVYTSLKVGNKLTALSLLKKITSFDFFYKNKTFVPLYQMKREDLSKEMFTYIEYIKENLDASDKYWADYLKASFYIAQNDFNSAKKILKNYDTSVALSMLGVIAFESKMFDASRKKIELALEKDYSNVLAHLYMGKLMIKNKNFGQALNHFTKAQSESGTIYIEATLLKGDVYFEYNKLDEALIIWKKVLSIDYRYSPAWERILNIKNKTGNS
jgi:tetratricopeptide (TPR) repeat protein